jgi:hypothetical protein
MVGAITHQQLSVTQRLHQGIRGSDHRSAGVGRDTGREAAGKKAQIMGKNFRASFTFRWFLQTAVVLQRFADDPLYLSVNAAKLISGPLFKSLHELGVDPEDKGFL